MGVRIVSAEAGLKEAATRLRTGQLVAFPTETVYGLGANALDAEAVARIYAAKGRPATNPLIVHVADVESARHLSSDWPAVADILAERFWPGPLTLVVPGTSAIPVNVTAGGSTVGIRIPAHPVALELLRHVGVPVAAPSANRSEEVSPTTAQHVADSLGPFVEDLLILDGGPCSVGVESTVLDVAAVPPRILRPGMVTLEELHELVGAIMLPPKEHASNIARSPGMSARHYAPKRPLCVVERKDIGKAMWPGSVLICYTEPDENHRNTVIRLPADPEGYASQLYAAMRKLDKSSVDEIVVEAPPDTPEWAAVNDRLRRASVPRDYRQP